MYSIFLSRNFKFSSNFFISDDTNRWIMRWLNRPTFEQFRPLRRDAGVFYNGSFIVRAQLYGGRLIGYELTLHTDRPFGYAEAEEYAFTVNANGIYTLVDSSDEIGDIYPTMEVTCGSAGTLTITNSMDANWSTVITDCAANEVITFNHPIVTTSSTTHTIQDCFNYNFPRISNTYDANTNTFTFSLPCSVTMSYNPIRKLGI